MNGLLTPYFNMLLNWRTLKGRTDRREYWSALFTLFLILAILLWFGDKIPILSYLPSTYMFLMLIPCFSATIRRLHDVGKRGYSLLWLLLPVIGFISVFVLLIREDNDAKGENN